MDTSGRSKLNGNKKSQIYKAIIEPIWAYRLQIWSTSTKVEYLKRGKSPIWDFAINFKRAMAREKRRNTRNIKNTYSWKGNYKPYQCST